MRFPTSSLAVWFAGAAIAVAFAIQAAAAMAASSEVVDETTYLRLGEDVYRRADFGRFPSRGVAPLPVVVSYVLPALAGSENDRDAIRLARVAALVAFGLPVLALTYFWLARDAGTLAGLVGAGLLALSPFFIAHASLAATDVSFVAGAIASLFALRLYVENASARNLCLLAFTLGLALSAKYSAIGLFPVVALTLFFDRQESERGLLMRALGVSVTTGGLVVVSIIVTWIVHGCAISWMEPPVVGPLPVPAPVHGILYQIRHAGEGHAGFLLGEVRRMGWWYYMPAALLMKSTPIELVLYGTCLFGFFSSRHLHSTSARIWRTTFLVFLGLAMTSRINIGVRYVLLLLPLAVLAGVERFSRSSWRFGGAALGAAVALQAWSAISIAPHYLGYFNAFVGGPAAGYRYLADSNVDWGQDLPALKATLERVGAERPLIAYFGTAKLSEYGVVGVRWPGTPADRAAADWLAISVTDVVGVYMKDDPFVPFLNIAPSARAAYSILLYKLDRPEVRSAMLDAARKRPD